MTRTQADRVEDLLSAAESLLDSLDGCEDPAVVHFRELLTETALSAMSLREVGQ